MHDDTITLDLEKGHIFEAPMCLDHFEIAVGEVLAVLEFRTLEGAGLRVPIPLASLDGLAAALSAAREVAAGDHSGTLQ